MHSDPAVRNLLEARIRAIATAQAESFGARRDYLPARLPGAGQHGGGGGICPWRGPRSGGDGRVEWNAAAVTGSEDFAFMLEKLPGCYFFIGNGDGDSAGACMVHNPGYNFNDDNIGVGSAMWWR